MLGAILLAIPHQDAASQRPVAIPETRPRILIAGQTDSASLALVEAVRKRLVGRRSSIYMVPAEAIALIVSEAYRDLDEPIAFRDMYEIGKLVRASVVVGVVPDSTDRRWLIAMIREGTRNSQSRQLGRWRANQPETAAAIADAVRADSLFRRISSAPRRAE